MTATEIQACRRSLDARLATRRDANRHLWERAARDADGMIRHVIENYHPSRIVQWGSVLHADHFDGNSDIDIAVEGDFAPETWFRMLGELWDMTDFSLDVVDLGKIMPEFAEIIRMKGTVVYDREQAAD
jgi:predicted nucleotidyltransferase